MSDRVRINLYKKKKIDPVGWFILDEEGDCPVCHATIEVDGVEYTTGATWGLLRGPLYGPVNPKTYEKARGMIVCEFIEPLKDWEVDILKLSCESLEGEPYGFDTLFRLVEEKAGPVYKLGKEPKLTVDHPICSEAVVYHCWKVNRPVCKALGKLEPRACTPANLYQSAKLRDVIQVVKEI